MNPNKALWEKGDFTRIAQSMRDSGEVLVKMRPRAAGSFNRTAAARTSTFPQSSEQE
jgi:hypothetical protein